MSDKIYTGEDFEEKVRKQVEFYFSDSNLQSDKFLFKIYEANNGWVELKTILTFGRMRQYRPEDKVIDALKKSEKLVLSANNETIRRKDPLKDFNELKNIRKKNTVHIEGFDKDASQDDIEEWFNSKIVDHLPKDKSFGSIRLIRNRASKEFFGVVDVEFKTQEDAEFFLSELTLSYPLGIVEKDDESVDQKSILKKMSLLTFREMKESGKRFGVNDVAKRRNSFNDNRGKKFRKGSKGKKREEDKENEKSISEEQEPESTSESKPEAAAEEPKAEEEQPKAEAESEA